MLNALPSLSGFHNPGRDIPSKPRRHLLTKSSFGPEWSSYPAQIAFESPCATGASSRFLWDTQKLMTGRKGHSLRSLPVLSAAPPAVLVFKVCLLKGLGSDDAAFAVTKSNYNAKQSNRIGYGNALAPDIHPDIRSQ